MLKELSVSVIVMSFIYLISFSAFATEQDMIDKVNFYDIPKMLGEKRSIIIDLQQDRKVYLWKMDKSVDYTDLDITNLKIEEPNLLTYIKPINDYSKSKNLDLVSYVDSFISTTDIPGWEALVLKPKELDDPGYIYYYSNGYLYGIDIFFQGEPEYLKETVIESLLENNYKKILGDTVLTNDIYSKGSSEISYKHNSDSFASPDGVNHYNNYSYIQFRNVELRDKFKNMKPDDKSIHEKTELQKKMGF